MTPITKAKVLTALFFTSIVHRLVESFLESSPIMTKLDGGMTVAADDPEDESTESKIRNMNLQMAGLRTLSTFLIVSTSAALWLDSRSGKGLFEHETFLEYAVGTAITVVVIACSELFRRRIRIRRDVAIVQDAMES